MRLIPSLLILVLLAGCSRFDEPNGLPTGYAHHRKEFRSAPGPEYYTLGYEYSAEKNAEILANLREIAGDLIGQVQREYKLNTDSVYLEPLDTKADPFELSMEFVLREELMKRGYVLSASPAFSLGMRFEAKEVPQEGDTANHHRLNSDIEAPAPDRKPHRPLALSLTLFDNQGIIGAARSVHDVAAYGFDNDKFALRFYDDIIGKPQR